MRICWNTESSPCNGEMDNRHKAIACLVASAFGFALMAFFVRLCDDFGADVSCFQKSLFRNFIALIIAATVWLRRHERAAWEQVRLSPGMWTLLLLRSAAGVVGIFGNFYALSVIPIGEAMTLNKTAPFFAVLFSWLFLRERACLRRLWWLVVAFAGAVMVMKPGFRANGLETFASFCALGGGIGAGIAYTCVRELGILKVDGAFIVLFFSAFSTLASLPFLSSGFDPMTPAQLLIMLLAGVGAAIGQFGVTAAYRYAPPREIAVFDYSNVIFTSLFGFAFFAQTPDAWSILGFALIVLSGIKSR